VILLLRGFPTASHLFRTLIPVHDESLLGHRCRLLSAAPPDDVV
jgi:hypothetical protein